MKCRWQELRKGPLASAAIDARIDGMVMAISAADARHRQRWPTTTTFAQDVATFRTWLGRRVEWLDRNLPGTCAAP